MAGGRRRGCGGPLSPPRWGSPRVAGAPRRKGRPNAAADTLRHRGLHVQGDAFACGDELVLRDPLSAVAAVGFCFAGWPSNSARLWLLGAVTLRDCPSLA